MILDQILANESDEKIEVEISEEKPEVAEPNPLPDTSSTSAILCLELIEKEEILLPDFMLDIESGIFVE
jgi:hypothetical protein